MMVKSNTSKKDVYHDFRFGDDKVFKLFVPKCSGNRKNPTYPPRS